MPQEPLCMAVQAHPAHGNVTRISASPESFSSAILFPFTQSFTRNQYCYLSAKQQQQVNVLMAQLVTR